jgi:hypothetical protein
VELSLWDKDERELVQGNKVGLAELGHLLGGGVHPGLHPGQFSAVPSGLDRRGETTQHCVLGYYRPPLRGCSVADCGKLIWISVGQSG